MTTCARQLTHEPEEPCMSAFLILSAMTSAMVLLLAALMDRQRLRSGGMPPVRILHWATVLSALSTLPVAWVIWMAAGVMPLVNLILASALWHVALYFLLSYWIKSLSRRLVARGQSKA
ncbi:MAG: hypothetical protein CFE34_14345 [Rhodobacteraceae bacterium PARR1]|nr:MAG: hypothetical protein CFE34_14345 [Rhodobacteraceae bacterium PARR1]